MGPYPCRTFRCTSPIVSADCNNVLDANRKSWSGRCTLKVLAGEHAEYHSSKITYHQIDQPMVYGVNGLRCMKLTACQKCYVKSYPTSTHENWAECAEKNTRVFPKGCPESNTISSLVASQPYPTIQWCVRLYDIMSTIAEE